MEHTCYIDSFSTTSAVPASYGSSKNAAGNRMSITSSSFFTSGSVVPFEGPTPPRGSMSGRFVGRLLPTEADRDRFGGCGYLPSFCHGIREHITAGLANGGEAGTSEMPENLIRLPSSSSSTITLAGCLGATMFTAVVSDQERAASTNSKASPPGWHLSSSDHLSHYMRSW